jgi:hypothetical protein
LLSNNDLVSNPTSIATNLDENSSQCSDLNKTVPQQIECLLKVRAKHAPSPANKSSFQDIDKIFQSFFGALMSASVATSLNSGQPQQNANNNTGGTTTGGTTTGNNNAPNQPSNNPSPNNNPSNQPNTVPILSSIILGRRLETQLLAGCTGTAQNPQEDAGQAGAATSGSAEGQVTPVKVTKPASLNTRLLVLEPTEGGGSYRVFHNFWVELFWRTPKPSFNGGAIITYFLIEPCTSTVLKSEVLHYIFDFSKFKKAPKDTWGANF